MSIESRRDLAETSARVLAPLSIRKGTAKISPALSRTPRHFERRKVSTDIMAQRAAVRTTYEVDRTLQPIYSGGSLSLSEDGRILAASLGEDVLLTDLTTGKELARVEGDGEVVTALACEYSP